MTVARIDEAEQITLGELLETPLVADIAIRAICLMRKALLAAPDRTREDAELESDISRIYYLIGQERRNQAHSRPSESKAQEPVARPLPKIIETKPDYAPKFDGERAEALCLVVLKKISQTQAFFTSTDLRNQVMELHLQGGKEFRPEELLKTPANNAPRWQSTMGNVLKRLREKEVIAYRKSKNDYVVL